MHAAEIRSRFLAYFERQAHAVRPSSPLVPADDPTLLFTNAGMVQFKKVFLGLETPAFGPRAVTSQKCVRAGGKHNDLEQVGHTARHHTFFEMLGNFSFGDYFKRDAIRFAWEFITEELRIDPRHLRVSVYESDTEARQLWKDIARLPDSRIYGLGEKDNFWQMADTGPCGPCSEIYVDLTKVAADWRFPENASGEWTDRTRDEYSLDAFVEGAEAGRFLEIWNLVFMQYDRQADGSLTPLPKPSVDTGAGLERIAAVMQGVTNNFHTEVFSPLIAAVEHAVGVPYWGRDSDEARHGIVVRTPNGKSRTIPNAVDPASFRVLADHARAVAFLLADGVFPSNEGRGYVLRRILRRGVRHAWLLGRTEPTLHTIVAEVVRTMSPAFPELATRRQHILDTTRAEEERFLATIEGGMRRFDELAPAHSTQGSTELRGRIAGADAFRLYDTFGFPIDLTELMARERGYTVDIAEFDTALAAQRTQSKEERKAKKPGMAAGRDARSDTTTWRRGEQPDSDSDSVEFVGYDTTEVDTQVLATSRLDDGRVAVLLRDTPFYAESGGQVSDAGEIIGDGWRIDVNEVRSMDGRRAAIGTLTQGSDVALGRALARVPAGVRKDTERNHTATHLLHAALRQLLGESVLQRGSLVAPDRLRFDFQHHGPVDPARLREIEDVVNRQILRGAPVTTEEMEYPRAIATGAMALFGEKYGDVVRVVRVPGFSTELCGGTHVKNTGEIALFIIVSETGIGSGTRRIEAVTGTQAHALARERALMLTRLAELARTPVEGLVRKLQTLTEERRTLERRLEDAMRGGGSQVDALLSGATSMDDARVVSARVPAADVKSLQAIGDALREQLGTGVAVLGASFEDGKSALLVVVTDDLRDRGVRADAIIKDVAAVAGGRGGGKPHMAQAGVPDAALLPNAIDRAAELVRPHLARAR